MVTAETTLERSPEPAAVPASDGWYDPDSIVFQATDHEELGARSSTIRGSDIARVDDREPVGAARR